MTEVLPPMVKGGECMRTTQDILEELIREFIEVNGIGELLKLIAKIVGND